MPLTNDSEIDQLLADTQSIAVIGASNRPERASYGVMKFLIDRGYRVIPVNPTLAGEMVHGQEILSTMAATTGEIDMVDIFRNSEAAAHAVDDAIALGAKSVWMQLGVINEEAAARAEAAGLKVVMDRCPKIELSKQS